VKNNPDSPSGKTSYQPETIPAGYNPSEIISKSVIDYALTVCNDKIDRQIVKLLSEGYGIEEIAIGSDAVKAKYARYHNQKDENGVTKVRKRQGKPIEGIGINQSSVSARVKAIKYRLMA